MIENESQSHRADVALLVSAPASVLLVSLIATLGALTVDTGSSHVTDSTTPDTAWVEREAWVMGTRLRMRLEAADRRVGVAEAERLLRCIEEVEAVLTTWRPGSELSNLNAADPGRSIRLSDSLGALLTEVAHWSHQTGRTFEPMLGALVDAWGFRGTPVRPTEDVLRVALENSGSGTFVIEATQATRRSSDAWIDSGAFGKGAALREALQLLRSGTTVRAEIDLGGQLLLHGLDHHVAIAHPRRRDEPLLRLILSDRSVATSGSSERFIEIDGERIGHILDPASGLPVPAWGSVTVVDRDPLVADILATALYVMGPDVGQRWLAARTDLDVGVAFLRLTESGVHVEANPGMDQWLQSPIQTFDPSPPG